jgi:succinate-acetate transporter protein
MAALGATPDQPVKLVHTAEESAAEAPLIGDPGLLGLPSFIVGSVAIGLVFVGVVPAGVVGAALPIILAATATGMFIAAIWAAAIGQSAVAGINGTFGGFWLSYVVLVLGLTHNWFGITLPAVVATEKLFLISWLAVIVMITLATLRLPLAFTGLFILVDVAVLLLLLGTVQASTSMLKGAGYVALVFAAVGAYIFFSSASQATGGKAFPLGRPVLH